MPRSRSISMLSSTCSFISRVSSPPQVWISRSARVDLPWSIWAMIAKLRICCRGFVILVPAIPLLLNLGFLILVAAEDRVLPVILQHLVWFKLVLPGRLPGFAISGGFDIMADQKNRTFMLMVPVVAGLLVAAVVLFFVIFPSSDSAPG